MKTITVKAKDDVFEPLTEEKYRELLKQGHEAVARFPVSSVRYDSANDKIVFAMKDGSTREVNVYDIEELRTASKSELEGLEFSFSGIHLEKLDIDISIEGLLKDKGLI